MTGTSEEIRPSEKLYAELSASGNSLRRRNAQLIRAACDLMEKDGVPINAAEVVRRCGPDGPAYSTIKNTGSQLGDYISLRMTEQLANAKGVRNVVRQDLADTVADPVLAAQIRDKESQVRWLMKENTGLRQLLKGLTPGVDIDNLLAKAVKGNAQLLPALAASTQASTDAPGSTEKAGDAPKALKAALLHLLDHLIGERGYKELRGRLTINAKKVLDQQEVEAIQLATGLSAEDWQRRYGAASGGGLDG
jgi:hypothetical protein